MNTEYSHELPAFHNTTFNGAFHYRVEDYPTATANAVQISSDNILASIGQHILFLSNLDQSTSSPTSTIFSPIPSTHAYKSSTSGNLSHQTHQITSSETIFSPWAQLSLRRFPFLPIDFISPHQLAQYQHDLNFSDSASSPQLASSHPLYKQPKISYHQLKFARTQQLLLLSTPSIYQDNILYRNTIKGVPIAGPVRKNFYFSPHEDPTDFTYNLTNWYSVTTQPPPTSRLQTYTTQFQELTVNNGFSHFQHIFWQSQLRGNLYHTYPRFIALQWSPKGILPITTSTSLLAVVNRVDFAAPVTAVNVIAPQTYLSSGDFSRAPLIANIRAILLKELQEQWFHAFDMIKMVKIRLTQIDTHCIHLKNSSKSTQLLKNSSVNTMNDTYDDCEHQLCLAIAQKLRLQYTHDLLQLRLAESLHLADKMVEILSLAWSPIFPYTYSYQYSPQSSSPSFSSSSSSSGSMHIGQFAPNHTPITVYGTVQCTFLTLGDAIGNVHFFLFPAAFHPDKYVPPLSPTFTHPSSQSSTSSTSSSTQSQFQSPQQPSQSSPTSSAAIHNVPEWALLAMATEMNILISSYNHDLIPFFFILQKSLRFRSNCDLQASIYEQHINSLDQALIQPILCSSLSTIPIVTAFDDTISTVSPFSKTITTEQLMDPIETFLESTTVTLDQLTAFQLKYHQAPSYISPSPQASQSPYSYSSQLAQNEPTVAQNIKHSLSSIYNPTAHPTSPQNSLLSPFPIYFGTLIHTRPWSYSSNTVDKSTSTTHLSTLPIICTLLDQLFTDNLFSHQNNILSHFSKSSLDQPDFDTSTISSAFTSINTSQTMPTTSPTMTTTTSTSLMHHLTPLASPDPFRLHDIPDPVAIKPTFISLGNINYLPWTISTNKQCASRVEKTTRQLIENVEWDRLRRRLEVEPPYPRIFAKGPPVLRPKTTVISFCPQIQSSLPQTSFLSLSSQSACTSSNPPHSSNFLNPSQSHMTFQEGHFGDNLFGQNTNTSDSDLSSLFTRGAEFNDNKLSQLSNSSQLSSQNLSLAHTSSLVGQQHLWAHICPLETILLLATGTSDGCVFLDQLKLPHLTTFSQFLAPNLSQTSQTLPNIHYDISQPTSHVLFHVDHRHRQIDPLLLSFASLQRPFGYQHETPVSPYDAIRFINWAPFSHNYNQTNNQTRDSSLSSSFHLSHDTSSIPTHQAYTLLTATRNHNIYMFTLQPHLISTSLSPSRFSLSSKLAYSLTPITRSVAPLEDGSTMNIKSFTPLSTSHCQGIASVLYIPGFCPLSTLQLHSPFASPIPTQINQFISPATYPDLFQHSIAMHTYLNHSTARPLPAFLTPIGCFILSGLEGGTSLVTLTRKRMGTQSTYYLKPRYFFSTQHLDSEYYQAAMNRKHNPIPSDIISDSLTSVAQMGTETTMIEALKSTSPTASDSSEPPSETPLYSFVVPTKSALFYQQRANLPVHLGLCADGLTIFTQRQLLLPFDEFYHTSSYPVKPSVITTQPFPSQLTIHKGSLPERGNIESMEYIKLFLLNGYADAYKIPPVRDSQDISTAGSILSNSNDKDGLSWVYNATAGKTAQLAHSRSQVTTTHTIPTTRLSMHEEPIDETPVKTEQLSNSNSNTTQLIELLSSTSTPSISPSPRSISKSSHINHNSFTLDSDDEYFDNFQGEDYPRRSLLVPISALPPQDQQDRSNRKHSLHRPTYTIPLRSATAFTAEIKHQILEITHMEQVYKLPLNILISMDVTDQMNLLSILDTTLQDKILAEMSSNKYKRDVCGKLDSLLYSHVAEILYKTVNTEETLHPTRPIGFLSSNEHSNEFENSRSSIESTVFPDDSSFFTSSTHTNAIFNDNRSTFIPNTASTTSTTSTTSTKTTSTPSQSEPYIFTHAHQPLSIAPSPSLFTPDQLTKMRIQLDLYQSLFSPDLYHLYTLFLDDLITLFKITLFTPKLAQNTFNNAHLHVIPYYSHQPHTHTQQQHIPNTFFQNQIAFDLSIAASLPPINSIIYNLPFYSDPDNSSFRDQHQGQHQRQHQHQSQWLLSTFSVPQNFPNLFFRQLSSIFSLRHAHYCMFLTTVNLMFTDPFPLDTNADPNQTQTSLSKPVSTWGSKIWRQIGISTPSQVKSNRKTSINLNSKLLHETKPIPIMTNVASNASTRRSRRTNVTTTSTDVEEKEKIIKGEAKIETDTKVKFEYPPASALSNGIASSTISMNDSLDNVDCSIDNQGSQRTRRSTRASTRLSQTIAESSDSDKIPISSFPSKKRSTSSRNQQKKTSKKNQTKNAVESESDWDDDASSKESLSDFDDDGDDDNDDDDENGMNDNNHDTHIKQEDKFKHLLAPKKKSTRRQSTALVEVSSSSLSQPLIPSSSLSSMLAESCGRPYVRAAAEIEHETETNKGTLRFPWNNDDVENDHFEQDFTSGSWLGYPFSLNAPLCYINMDSFITTRHATMDSLLCHPTTTISQSTSSAISLSDIDLQSDNLQEMYLKTPIVPTIARTLVTSTLESASFFSINKTVFFIYHFSIFSLPQLHDIWSPYASAQISTLNTPLSISQTPNQSPSPDVSTLFQTNMPLYSSSLSLLDIVNPSDSITSAHNSLFTLITTKRLEYSLLRTTLNHLTTLHNNYLFPSTRADLNQLFDRKRGQRYFEISISHQLSQTDTANRAAQALKSSFNIPVVLNQSECTDIQQQFASAEDLNKNDNNTSQHTKTRKNAEQDAVGALLMNQFMVTSGTSSSSSQQNLSELAQPSGFEASITSSILQFISRDVLLSQTYPIDTTEGITNFPHTDSNSSTCSHRNDDKKNKSLQQLPWMLNTDNLFLSSSFSALLPLFSQADWQFSPSISTSTSSGTSTTSTCDPNSSEEKQFDKFVVKLVFGNQVPLTPSSTTSATTSATPREDQIDPLTTLHSTLQTTFHMIIKGYTASISSFFDNLKTLAICYSITQHLAPSLKSLSAASLTVNPRLGFNDSRSPQRIMYDSQLTQVLREVIYSPLLLSNQNRLLSTPFAIQPLVSNALNHQNVDNLIHSLFNSHTISSSLQLSPYNTIPHIMPLLLLLTRTTMMTVSILQRLQLTAVACQNKLLSAPNPTVNIEMIKSLPLIHKVATLIPFTPNVHFFTPFLTETTHPTPNQPSALSFAIPSPIIELKTRYQLLSQSSLLATAAFLPQVLAATFIPMYRYISNLLHASCFTATISSKSLIQTTANTSQQTATTTSTSSSSMPLTLPSRFSLLFPSSQLSPITSSIQCIPDSRFISHMTFTAKLIHTINHFLRPQTQRLSHLPTPTQSLLHSLHLINLSDSTQHTQASIALLRGGAQGLRSLLPTRSYVNEYTVTAISSSASPLCDFNAISSAHENDQLSHPEELTKVTINYNDLLNVLINPSPQSFHPHLNTIKSIPSKETKEVLISQTTNTAYHIQAHLTSSYRGLDLDKIAPSSSLSLSSSSLTSIHLGNIPRDTNSSLLSQTSAVNSDPFFNRLVTDSENQTWNRNDINGETDKKKEENGDLGNDDNVDFVGNLLYPHILQILQCPSCQYPLSTINTHTFNPINNVHLNTLGITPEHSHCVINLTQITTPQDICWNCCTKAR